MTRAHMPLDVPGYRADTGHLSTTEHGAYLLLIMHYWMTGGLPDNDAKLARITGMGQNEWAEAKPTLEALFTAGWRHKRIERELGKARLSEKRAEAGRLGAAVTNGDCTKNLTPAKIETTSLSIESKKIKKERERGTRLPADWVPSSADIEAAKVEGLSDSDIAREAAKFRDYWLAKPGQGGVKLDWPATWRNWCRRAADYLGRKPKLVSVNGETPSIFIPIDSPKWGQLANMWREQNRQTSGPPPRDYEGKSGWWFPREWAGAA